MWMHSHTKTKYSHVDFEGSVDGTAQVTSAATGRVFSVPADRIVPVSDHEELRPTFNDDYAALKKEHIDAAAHALARLLPYNLGRAVTLVAQNTSESLLSASAAIRDELERRRQAAADALHLAGRETDDGSDEPLRPWIEQHPPVRSDDYDRTHYFGDGHDHGRNEFGVPAFRD